MSESTIALVRPDVDILADIEAVIVHYPPLQQDRHHFKVRVQSGSVVISGHVRTPITRRYLLDRVGTVADVTEIDATNLHTEEEIRLAAAKVVPDGVLVNVRYGVVILNGKLPEGVTAEAVAQAFKTIPGVERVAESFV